MKKILLFVFIIVFLFGFVMFMRHYIQKDLKKNAAENVEKKVIKKDDYNNDEAINRNSWKNHENLIPRKNNSSGQEEKKRISEPAVSEIIIPAEKSKLRIVIDDCGGNIELLRKFLELDYDMMYAVIPGLRYSEESFELIKKYARPAMIHLPMEPEDYKIIEKNRSDFILTAMTNSEISTKMESILRKYPLADGLNNHMGSKASADMRVCESVLSAVLKYNSESGKKLFFFDSKTTPASNISAAAKKYGVRFFVNDGFIDNSSNEEKIYERIKLFMHNSDNVKKRKTVIGHLRPSTYAALKRVFNENKY